MTDAEFAEKKELIDRLVKMSLLIGQLWGTLQSLDVHVSNHSDFAKQIEELFYKDR